MIADDFEERVAGVASLAEPQRRALYRYVVTRDAAVGKDEAAAAMGMPRWVAAFHLDRLVADGLLTTEYRRLSGRQGRGAGRPAKLYRRSERELSVSLPDRRYELAGRLLAGAVNAATRAGIPVAQALTRISTEQGRRLGDRARELAGKRASRRTLIDAALIVLDEHGYEPRPDSDEIALANCPFHALVREQHDLVCGMNHDLLSGMTAAVGDDVLGPAGTERRQLLRPPPGQQTRRQRLTLDWACRPPSELVAAIATGARRRLGPDSGYRTVSITEAGRRDR